MHSLQCLFCVVIIGSISVSLGFHPFKFTRLAPQFKMSSSLDPPSSSRRQEHLKSGVENMNASVSDLLQRVQHLETTGGPNATVVQDELRTMRQNQQNMSTAVGKLLSSFERIEERADAAIKAQEDTMASLTSENKRLEWLLKDMKRSIPDSEVVSHNLALHKPTKSSSVRRFWRTDGPVDGSFVTLGWSRSCFQSDLSDKLPWWQVDFESRFLITEVKVTARGDCCSDGLNGIVVEVFNEDPTTVPIAEPQLCYTYDGRDPNKGETISRNCMEGVAGRYLRITGRERKVKNHRLTFCEVQVFGPSVSD